MSSITCLLQDEDGNGLPNQDVKLRRLGASNYGVDVYTMSDVAGEPGSYEYSGGHVTDTYKVWVNGNEDKSFGGNSGVDIIRLQDVLLKSGGTMTGDILMGSNRIKQLPDPADNDEPETKGRIAGFISQIATDISNAIGTALLKAGGTMAGNINMNNNRITDLPLPSDNYEPLRLLEGNRYHDKRFSAPQQNIYSKAVFYVNQYLTTDPVDLLHIANRKFVENYCAKIIGGTGPTAYQQSYNIIRCLYSAQQEDNRAYFTLESSILAAEAFASATRQMTVLIEGMGIGTEYLTYPDYNLMPESVDPYVHIHGTSSNVITRLGDTTYSSENLWENVLSGLVFDNIDDLATSIFVKKIFINCEFRNTYGTGGYNFQNCIFLGTSNRFGAVDKVFDSNCKGEYYDITNQKKYMVSGMNFLAWDLLNDSGDLRPRRYLGRKGSDIASNITITLGEGNFFYVTGTNNISQIVSLGFTPGSMMFLEFADVLDLKHDDFSYVGFWLKGLADKTTSAGMVVGFVLSQDSQYWREI